MAVPPSGGRRLHTTALIAVAAIAAGTPDVWAWGSASGPLVERLTG
jgi:hypothetical protein